MCAIIYDDSVVKKHRGYKIIPLTYNYEAVKTTCEARQWLYVLVQYVIIVLSYAEFWRLSDI